MLERASKIGNRASQRCLDFLQELLRGYSPRNFAVELWDGAVWPPENRQFCNFTWKINDPGTVRRLASAGEVALAEGYIFGDYDIEGNIEAIFPLADYLINKKWTAREKLHLGRMLLSLPAKTGSRVTTVKPKLQGRSHTPHRDRQAVTYHYDVSNDFYGLWLDKRMVYSCAYFSLQDEDLDTAQHRKLDYICRKLRLKPGERLLDIGCGWGALVMHAAREYGVHALGITLSERQLEFACRQIREEGLSDRCSVRLVDYRHLEESSAFDKLVSVGMVEHVGESNLAEYFQQAFRSLKPGGVFLNHGIGIAGNRPAPDHPTFTDVYVFPNGELIPISKMLSFAEHQGFEIRDVENLREHYVLTLVRWVNSLESNANEARQLVGEIKYRIWRLYMAGSAYYFRTGRLDLYQTLLLKGDKGHAAPPLTREDWYR
jgi:cyclopropane-fatty-acyl-phospholipid synthase